MSSLTGKSLNPVMNRRSVIASAAGLGAMSILAGCSSNGGDSGSASGDASFKIGTIGPLTGANASYGKSVTQAVELGCKDFSTKELPLVSKAEDDQADGEKAVNAAFDTIAANLEVGEKVQLVGFGVFDIKERGARIGRNPKTKEEIEIPATRVPVFKAGKVLKDAVSK